MSNNAPGPMQGGGCHYAQAMADQTPRYDNAVRKRKRKRRKRKLA